MGGMAGLAELRVMLSTGRRADLGLGTAAAIGVGARWGAVTGAGGGEEEREGWRMRNLGAQPPPADAAESGAVVDATEVGITDLSGASWPAYVVTNRSTRMRSSG